MQGESKRIPAPWQAWQSICPLSFNKPTPSHFGHFTIHKLWPSQRGDREDGPRRPLYHGWRIYRRTKSSAHRYDRIAATLFIIAHEKARHEGERDSFAGRVNQ